jgi:hypothetical protein
LSDEYAYHKTARWTIDNKIVRRGDGGLTSIREQKGIYKKRSRHANPSNGYNTVAEQTYGEQGNTKTTILPKNTPVTHPIQTISLANSFTIGISFNNALDTDSDGISANLSSSNPTTSGVRSLGS